MNLNKLTYCLFPTHTMGDKKTANMHHVYTYNALTNEFATCEGGQWSSNILHEVPITIIHTAESKIDNHTEWLNIKSKIKTTSSSSTP